MAQVIALAGSGARPTAPLLPRLTSGRSWIERSRLARDRAMHGPQGRQPAPLEKRLDPRRPSIELLEQHSRLLRPRAGENLRTEDVPVFTRHPAMLVEPLAAVSRQHFAPDVSVVRGRIAA